MPSSFIIKAFSFFIRHDISASEFWDIEVIVCQSELGKQEKEILLFQTVGAWKQLMTAHKKTLAAICTIIKNSLFL